MYWWVKNKFYNLYNTQKENACNGQNCLNTDGSFVCYNEDECTGQMDDIEPATGMIIEKLVLLLLLQATSARNEYICI